ncbi:MAG TPA: protein kinase [Terracidiphilus sp.]|nr:protein kinase [Terracidiphilus sp.]
MDATTVKKKIGKYEITGILGRGGMGVVYRAEDRRIGRLVAIKTLTEGFSGQPDMLERFYREAQAGILQHPNIVIVYDLGDEDGVPFIVMEYVDGEPLDRLIAAGRQLPLIDKLSIIEQVCAALGYAHQRGVVHRDIKPANVIVQPDGQAKIVDFGIARVQSAKESGLTRTGNVIGTVHYIAPERLKGQPFDGRSDIFSTGVMLYLLLAGQLPFTGEDLAVLQKLVNDPAPPLKTYLTNYPPALDGILDRALAKDPAQRYPTAEEFAADLHALIEELKKGQVVELFGDAERLAAEEQFGRAREILLQLVRIDPQHTGARQLLGVVQQHLARLQRAEQVRQLIAEADEALAASRYVEALAAFDQAARLDPGNDQLKARIEDALEKKRRHDEVDNLMTQASSLRDRGDLTGAMNAVEKALRLDQNNTGIRSIYADLARQAKIAAQQGQIREMLGKARQELSAGRFTAAIEILQEAGKLDPSQPEVETLLQTAASGQEQERRRRLLEQVHAEIEKCLAVDDCDRAAELVARAVERLPNESSLLQLKTRVAVQARQLRTRQLIESTTARAQETFLQSPGEALLIVQKALQELPGEERLLLLESSLRERLKSAEKEEVRGRYLHEAQDAIDRSQFEKAVEILESYQLEFADAAGVEELLQFARGELAGQKRRAQIAAYVAQARPLLETQQFAQAIRLLEPACAETGDASLARLLADAREQLKEFERKAEALLARIARLRERGNLDEAIALLQDLPAASSAGTPLNSLLVEIRTEKDRKQAIEKALAAVAPSVEKNDFTAAIESLQSVQRAWGESAELTRAITEIESKRGQHANQVVAKAIEAARTALVANDTTEALRELRAASNIVGFASAAQQADWKRLSAEAAKPQARKVTGQIAMPEAPAEAAKGARKLPIPLLAGVAVAVLAVAVVVGWFTFHKPPPPPPPHPTPVPNPIPVPPIVVPTGTLMVQGNVAEVNVFVDGVLKGFTLPDGSLKLPLDPGQHSIHLEKAHYAPLPASTVTIARNAQQVLRFTMTPSSGPTPPAEVEAYLSIQTTPGASVSIDNAPQGKTDERGSLIVEVKPGAHRLELALNGYQSYTQSFTIKAGQRNNTSVQLSPIPPAPKPTPPPPVEADAYLSVQSNPGASVSIDNAPQGKTDERGSLTVELKPGSHNLELALNGYQSYNMPFTIKAGQRNSTAVILTPIPAPPVPVPPPHVDDGALIQAALNGFTGAFNSHNVRGMQAAWPGMTSKQARDYDSFFKSNSKARVAENCPAGALSISGDTANWDCTEVTTIVAGGGPQSIPHGVHFTFSKKGDSWVITQRR